MTFISVHLVKIMQKKEVGQYCWMELDGLNITMQLLKRIKGESDIIVPEADYQINRREPRERDWARQIVCTCNSPQYGNA